MAKWIGIYKKNWVNPCLPRPSNCYQNLESFQSWQIPTLCYKVGKRFLFSTNVECNLNERHAHTHRTQWTNQLRKQGKGWPEGKNNRGAWERTRVSAMGRWVNGWGSRGRVGRWNKGTSGFFSKTTEQDGEDGEEVPGIRWKDHACFWFEKKRTTTTTKKEGTGEEKEGSVADKSDAGGMEVATMKSGQLPQQHFFQRIDSYRAFLQMAQVSV